ncbi:glycoside hydrolase family 3 C-terminal domain-containing protein [Arcticibacter eurypsychrophilus]|uniref:glycoside hydrolase family 3 C-terminal domain-containing protein n=1 Tax=Arcticibacter eurypsychrophilus TaxID=1434752 RepID=UPI001B8D7712|nr:glycoside hydrolase family 3 C-terminal domain-containing protein [Arcticibacter eurypsychrophilus]
MQIFLKPIMLKKQKPLNLILLLLLVSGPFVQAQTKYPFQNPNLDVEKRISNILSLMNLEEKIVCLGTTPSVPRLGIVGAGHVEGLHGLALGIPGDWGHKTPVATTTFPQAIGMAETWEPELLKQAAGIEGYEARYLFQSEQYKKGGLVIRAPNADLGRDPRWGRTEECYGEDAFFNGTMAVAYIKGLQGDDPKYWLTAALMKHFLANSNEKSRDSSSSNFNERLLREYYSVPFRMGVKEGGSRAYMAAYNRINGIPAAVNPILKDITVKEWGQNGIICTDGGAYQMLVNAHHYFPTLEEAAAACVKAGINQFLDDYEVGIKGALELKILTEKDIDQVLKGVFRVMIKLGQLDPKEIVSYAQIKDGPEPWLSEKNKSFARLITQKSVVLLKNSKSLLPLDVNKIKSIAVVGPRSNEVALDWYSGSPAYTVSPLEGIKNKVASKAIISHTTNNDLAISLAKSAEVAIVCIGNHPTGNMSGWAKVSNTSEGREAVDREEILLDSAQENLIKKVYAVNPNTIVVLISSFPYAINWAQENIPAIVHLTHNSQELGNGLADVLFGDVNPAGRLVQTWPKSTDQLPPMMDYDIRKGRTYMYFKDAPLYPFGYGLSYSSFSYSNLFTTPVTQKKEIKVQVNVTNTSAIAGDEVVQLYISHLNSKIDRPLKELKGFKRITLQPKETKTVEINMPLELLKYWNIKTKRFDLEHDKIQIMIGSSSANIHLRKELTL